MQAKEMQRHAHTTIARLHEHHSQLEFVICANCRNSASLTFGHDLHSLYLSSIILMAAHESMSSISAKSDDLFWKKPRLSIATPSFGNAVPRLIQNTK